MDFANILNHFVSIQGRGGYVHVTKNNSIRTSRALKGTMRGSAYFTVEQPPEYSGTRKVALRSAGGLYLSVSLFGSEAKESYSDILAQHDALIELGLVRMIIEYLGVPDASSVEGFEGAGFCYTPSFLVQGPPSELQLFDMVHIGNTNRVRLKTHNGDYLRSQHWDGTIGLAPHCQEDETWWIQIK